MRETSKSVDDVFVRLSEPGVLGITDGGDQFNAALLIGSHLAVFEWQVEKQAPIAIDGLIKARRNGGSSCREGLRVRGEGRGSPAEDVAWELIQNDDTGKLDPALACDLVDRSAGQGGVQVSEAKANFGIDLRVPNEPSPRRNFVEPEAQHVFDPTGFAS